MYMFGHISVKQQQLNVPDQKLDSGPWAMEKNSGLYSSLGDTLSPFIQNTEVGIPITLLWHAGKTVCTDYMISHTVMVAIL